VAKQSDGDARVLPGERGRHREEDNAVTRLRMLFGSRAFKIALSALMLAVLFSQTDLRQMRAAIAAADLRWLAVAVLGLIGSQIVSAYRWYILARPVGFDEPFGRVCAYYFSGMYLNLFGPGTVTGDVGRTLFLAGGRRRALAFTTVVAHRLTGFVALVWITAVAVLVLGEPMLPAIADWLAVAVVPATVVGWLWGPRLAARLLPPTSRWRRLIEQDLAPYWHKPAVLASALGWAAVAHSIQFGCQIAVARAIGLQIPWSFFLVIVPIVGLVSVLPMSLQGIGIRETGYLLYLSRIGVPREAALALGLLSSAAMLASGLSGLPFFALQRRAGGRADSRW
jgi:uncharacterized membrane protein YbhN (UPF0104 family)